MKLLCSIIASAFLLTTSHPTSAQFNDGYFFQHEVSVRKSNGGCALGIVYPSQGPLTFEYKPNENIVRVSYQVKGTAGLTGDNQEMSFVLNASDPSPNASESIPFHASGNGSVTVVNDHLLINVTVPNGDQLIDFLSQAYSISFGYRLAEGDSVEIEGFDLWDLSVATEKLKACAKAVSSDQ